MSEKSENPINESLHFSCQITLCYDNIGFFFHGNSAYNYAFERDLLLVQGGHDPCSIKHVYYWIEFCGWRKDKICKKIK